jgi:hypothetical protein
MSRTQLNVRVRRGGAVVAGVLLLLTGWLPLATASAPSDPSFSNGCTLERIGTQLVRCDYLTGAGVRAPSSVPEVGRRAVRKNPSDGCQ